MSRYRPRHQGQLGRGTKVPGRTQGSRDCGPRSWQVLIDYLTKGKRRPGVSKLRKRANTVGPQQTSILDGKRAIESWAGLKVKVLTTSKQVKDVMANGGVIHAAISYRTYNRLLKKTGDPNFMGGHSIALLDEKRRSGSVYWLVFDSLDDRRRNEIPQGPRWIKRKHIMQCMDAFAPGSGKVYASKAYGRLKR